MTEIGQRIADAAVNLIGAKFRLHGRDPKTGLDCVGVVFCSLKSAGLAPSAPVNYGLRNRSDKQFLRHFYSSGLCPVSGRLTAGDVIFAKAGPAQFHLLIATGPATFVHAHAGLRRVVNMRGQLAWPEQQIWRCTQSADEDI